LTDKEVIDVGTLGGNIQLHISGDLVRVDMGPPELEPADIPFQAEQQAVSYLLEVEDKEYQIGAVSMGNPHAVLQVDSVDAAPVGTLGPLIECHPRFPQRVNVGFMQVCSPEHIRLRVFERGTGETLACGSGACGAVVVGQIQGLLGRRVRVSLPGGDLMIEWGGGTEPVWMSGPATTVYEGKISL
jgi:diaminopimelate epimerase